MGSVGVIVVAAGKGKRMGVSESKQYLKIGGRPLLIHALKVFQDMPEIDDIVLVVGAEDTDRGRSLTERYGLTKVGSILAGGAQRQESVYRGLQALCTEWVLVHDAVRPFVTSADILRCRDAAVRHGAAVLAVPVKDTIKKADEHGNVAATLPRESLWAVQTPQAFRRSLLLKAHEAARNGGFTATDDAGLVEKLGETVHLVRGDYNNIKITTPDDLAWAEWHLNGPHGIHNRTERERSE